ncbi:MAG: DUF1810 domain-containing protein [Neisseriaceae bacterium]|nr:DUF1810 domain-containing protein [Neisseriaceae bacterium]
MLQRFIDAQKADYELALKEIKNGKKENHYMWYIFPQIVGLGQSRTAQYYAIQSKQELADYWANDYLKNNLCQITQELLHLNNNDISSILGYPDDLKLKSSVTLFYLYTQNLLFKQILDKYYQGEMDNKTVRIYQQF